MAADRNSPPARFFGYARVSTDMQASEGESLSVQQRQLEGWAMQRGVIERYEVAAGNPVPVGAQVLRFDFAYDGGRPGAGGVAKISVGGAALAEGRIARTQPFAFSADEGADVGEDLATPVTEEYQVPAKFTGTIHKITIDVQLLMAADRPAVDAAAAEGLLRQAASE